MRLSTVARVPLLNAWKLEGRRLVDALPSGERVLAFTPTDLGRTEFAGTWLEARLAGAPGDKPSGFWKVAGAIGAVVDFVPGVGDKVAAKFENDPVSGDPDSVARRVGREVDAAPLGAQRYLAVTDRRFLVLHAGKSALTNPLVVIAAVDRATVRGAEVRSNLLSGSIGRLRVTFDDGSWLEFADALNMGRQRAAQVRDALVDGHSSIEADPGPPQP